MNEHQEGDRNQPLLGFSIDAIMNKLPRGCHNDSPINHSICSTRLEAPAFFNKDNQHSLPESKYTETAGIGTFLSSHCSLLPFFINNPGNNKSAMAQLYKIECLIFL